MYLPATGRAIISAQRASTLRAQVGFLISISSASGFLYTAGNQNFHFLMVRFHFPIEEMGGEERTLHYFSSLSCSSSPGICQKKILSPVLISAHAAALTLNPGRQLSPAQLPYSDIPWHRISLEAGGGVARHPPALHLLLASCTKHYGMYGVGPHYVCPPPRRWNSIRLLLAPPCPPLYSQSRPFPSMWAGLPQSEVLRKLGIVLGLKNLSPQPVANWHFACGSCEIRQANRWQKPPWKRESVDYMHSAHCSCRFTLQRGRQACLLKQPGARSIAEIKF